MHTFSDIIVSKDVAHEDSECADVVVVIPCIHKSLYLT